MLAWIMRAAHQRRPIVPFCQLFTSRGWVRAMYDAVDKLGPKRGTVAIMIGTFGRIGSSGLGVASQIYPPVSRPLG